MKQAATVQPLVRRGITGRLAEALPSPAQALAGGLSWGVAMAASTCLGIGRVNGGINGHLVAIVLLFLAGGALAFPLAQFAARLSVSASGLAVRLVVAIIILAIATIATTAMLFALDNARFYVGWTDLLSGPFGLFEILITILVSLAGFAVLGVRLLIPYGLLALLAGGLWLAFRIR